MARDPLFWVLVSAMLLIVAVMTRVAIDWVYDPGRQICGCCLHRKRDCLCKTGTCHWCKVKR